MSSLPAAVPDASPSQGLRGAPGSQRRTAPVELLWDLVFVFAITQVTTLLAHRPSWGRFGQAMVVLALVWWAWSAFVWAANAQETDSRVLRACLLTATVLIFIVGLALPRAFGAEGLLFASAYALVRFLHLGLYTHASRIGNASWSAIVGFAITICIGMALLIAGAIAHGWLRVALWTLAVAIDYAGPAWLTRERLRGLQEVAVDHFAERYGAFVIIALGESIGALGVGVGTADRHLSAELVLGALLALLTAIGMWWTYFDRIAERAQLRLAHHEDPVLAAADSYSYLHLVIIAGIIIYAGGVKLVVHNSVSAPMPDTGRLTLCGGVAVYLLGIAAFRLRLLDQISYGRIGAALGLLVLYAVGGGLPAWAVAAAIAGLVGALCVVESLIEETGPGETRARGKAQGRGEPQVRAEPQERVDARAGEAGGQEA